jgi:hypothetical protein
LAEIEFTVDSPGKRHTGLIRDLSVRGIGLVSSQRIEPGTRLEIHLPGTAWNCATSLPAVIRHATEMPDGAWVLGVCFSRVVTADDFLALNSRPKFAIAFRTPELQNQTS